mgnify:CR=1 FL=1
MDNFNEDSYFKRQKLKSIGEKLPMTLNWADIKIGMTCHIPPINNSKRKTFKVLDKTKYWIRIKFLDESDEQPYSSNYIYSYDIDSKFITEIK